MNQPDAPPSPMPGTVQVKATLTQQWLFNLQNMVATLVVEPILLEEAARPLALALMRSGVARLEALESTSKEKISGQPQ